MKPIHKRLLRPMLLIMTLLFSGSLSAKDSSYFQEMTYDQFYIISGIIFVLLLLVLAVLFVIMQIVRQLLMEIRVKNAPTAVAEKVPSWWSNIWVKANDFVPIDEEKEILLDHNYDGIRELDNHLPPWWKWMFYLSIVFAVVYMFLHHISDIMPLQAEEYDIAVAEAEYEKAARLAAMPGGGLNENTVTIATSQSALYEGKQVYIENCAQCHLQSGGGNIGPNLTDDYWLHGASISEVFKTIKYGYPEKGMIAWESKLSPKQMQNVSSYILTLRGTNPSDGKEPQGELVVVEADSTEAQ